MQANPGETRDVIATHPDVFAYLEARLVQWESHMQTPLWREGKRWERNQRYKHRMDTLGREMERKYP